MIRGLFEPNYHTWIQLNVRAMLKTKIFSKKIVSEVNSDQRSCSYFSAFVSTFNLNVSESRDQNWKQVSVSCTLPRRKHLSEKITGSQLQIENDGFTPPDSTNNKWTKFGDLKAVFEGKTNLVEQVWEQNYFLKKLFLRKITWETIFSML